MDPNLQNEIQAQYLAALTNNCSLTQLCNITAHYCSVPVAITLVTRTIIAKSDDYTSDLVNEYMNHMELSTEAEIIERENYVNSQLLSKHTIIGTFPFMRYKHINCGCFQGSSMLGVLDCPVIKKVDINDVVSIIEMAAPIFLTALKLNSYVSNDCTDPMQTYLNGLLFNDERQWFQQQYLSFSPILQINSWNLSLVAVKHEDSFYQTKQIIEKFCRRRNYFWYTVYKKELVILSSADSKKELDQLAERLNGLAKICLSEDYSDLNDTKQQLHLAQLVLRIIEFEGNDASLIFVQKYKFLIPFLVYFSKPNPESIKLALMDSIKKYDEEHLSQYFLTLRTYLLCEGNYAEMAKKLYVHKNTVIYRMQRITEIFHLNLKDCRTIAELYISLFLDFRM